MSNKVFYEGEYQGEKVFVDSTRYVIGSTTYPINTIASVNAHTIVYEDEESGSWTHCIIGGLVGAIGAASMTGAGVVIAALGFGYAALMYPRVTTFPDKYSVQVSTAAGSTDTIVTLDQKFVQGVTDAINEAIISRG
jgi:hypothetical protein